ncbi:MAG: UPF0149 family protein [Cypionkella sp.]
MSWHADEDLERLDAALMALPADNDPMLLTEFDGFCAGLITCPEMIPPSVWLRQVWGPDGAMCSCVTGSVPQTLRLEVALVA